MKATPPARIHLLPAKSAPYVVVIRRKPTDWFHVMRWNTATDQVEHSSWYKGKIFVKRSDVSFDGNWLIFLARDFGGYKAWNCIGHPPLLQPVVNVDSESTYHGGGYWSNESTLRLNGWSWPFFRDLKSKAQSTLPFTLEEYAEELEDFGVLYHRLTRDGWCRTGDNWGTKTEVESSIYEVQCTGDDGWKFQLTPEHPTLRMVYTGYRNGNHQFRFWLEEFPDLINVKTDWGCWGCLGQLILSCEGILYKYDINGFHEDKPKTVINLEHLTPPDVRCIT
jgi:hypothetical protein